MELTNFRFVASGGTSTVYLAEQVELRRPVAVKVINVDVSDATAWERFQRECRIAGHLSADPGVVTVFSTGRTVTGSPFIVMEYMEGGSLRKVLADTGRLRPAQVAAIGASTGGALVRAHELKIVHRDVKPENVLVDRSGTTKLADFGISAMAGSTIGASGTGTTLFTPEHVAPEVLKDEVSGTFSDVYSLCSMLYTLLEGRSPFRAAPSDSIAVLLTRKVTSNPFALTVEAPNGLVEVIMAGLASDHDDRPSAQDIVDVLGSLEHEPLWAPGDAQLVPLGPIIRTPSGIGEDASTTADPHRTIIRAEVTQADLTVGRADMHAAGRVGGRRLRTRVLVASAVLVPLLGATVAMAASRRDDGDVLEEIPSDTAVDSTDNLDPQVAGVTVVRETSTTGPASPRPSTTTPSTAPTTTTSPPPTTVAPATSPPVVAAATRSTRSTAVVAAPVTTTTVAPVTTTTVPTTTTAPTTTTEATTTSSTTTTAPVFIPPPQTTPTDTSRPAG